MNIIPRPTSIVEKEGVFEFGKATQIKCPLKVAGEMLTKSAETAVAGKGAVIFKKTPLDCDYRVTIAQDEIVAEAVDDAGFFHASVTIMQLAYAYNGKIPCAVIEDLPRFKYRAALLDVSRYFYDVDTVKRFIDSIALFKFNYLHLHLCDDQGFRLQIEALPLLTEIGSVRSCTCGDGVEHKGFYTKAQIADLVAYAADRAIEIIPEIDVPGHMTAAIAAYPGLSCNGEKREVATEFGIYDGVLCAGKECTYEMLGIILKEVAEMFPCKYVHLGGDEVPKICWDSCEDCKNLMRREGLKDYEQLQGYLTNRTIDILKKHGKTAILWNESLLAGTVDSGALIQYWSYGKAHAEAVAKAISESGRKVIMSHGGYYYLNCPYGVTPIDKTYGLEPVLRIFGPNGEEGLEGVECALWTEHIDNEKELFLKTYPRAMAVAETGWTPKEAKNKSGFMRRVKALLPMLDKLGVPYMSLKKCSPGLFGIIAQSIWWLQINERKRNKYSARNWYSTKLKPKDL